MKWKTQVQGRTKHALLADGDEDEAYYEDEDEDAYFEDEEATDQAEVLEEAFVNYSDDETLDALLGELPPNALEDSSLADAFATVAQFKQKGKGGGKKHGPPAGIPFRASGDITFEQKAKEQRKSAVKFLKAVTFCTACEKKGHWAGDPECSKGGKKGKGRGISPNKKFVPSSKKKPSNVMFVLHDHLESDEEALLQDNFEVTEYAEVSKSEDTSTNDLVPVDDAAVKNDMAGDSAEAPILEVKPAPSFTNYVDTTSRQHEVFMVLKDISLCERSSYFGGNERQYHRGANGHTRHIRCREADCNSTVILARRKEPVQLWKYLTLIALCTKWGKEARSRELAQSVAKHSLLALEDAAPVLPLKNEPNAKSPPPGWSLVEGEGKKGYPQESTASASASGAKTMKAKIVYEPEMQAWLYGVHLALETELPPFPELAGDDLKILQPLPTDDTLITTGPLAGLTFVVAASVPQYEWWCKETLQHALKNEPMVPEIFRFAFYLYGRVNLVRSAAIQMVKGGVPAQSKRSSDSGQMSTTRSMQIPLQMRRDDPMSLETKFCDVMMVDDQVAIGEEDAFKVTGSSEEKPGLAILDSGCTRSVHSAQWAEAFEEELKKRGLKPKIRNKKQTFRGIGGNSESDIVKVFPVHLGGVPGELHSAETKEGNFPLLISRPFMEHLGTVIKFKAGTVSFTAIGVSDLPLLNTSRGHLAVSLLDFDGGGRDQEAFTTVADEFPEWDSPMSQKGLSLPPEACRSQQQLEAEVPSQLQPETPEGYERGYTPTIPDSDNPDPGGDSPSYQDYIESLRMDVEGYEEFMRERGEDPYPHMDSGEHCDDPEHFEVLLSDQEFCVFRKATNKKQKRIAMMSAMLDAEEFNRLRKIRGEIGGPVPRKPHVGKTWLKQLFAGQMGLSVLAVFLGMQVGVPLDISSSCWDATTKHGKNHLHRDLLVEDPYVLVITHPCGPWGNWSRFNLAKGGASAETVNLLREENRPVLALVNKVVKDRVKAQRHVFLEQPLGSKSLEEPEMSDVKQMVEEEKLIFLRVDGCMVGYMDAESKKPHNKPSYYLTTMVAAENIFEGIRCDGSHEHEPLEGANRYGPRTAQAAEWPMKLNRMVLEAVIQQSEIEKNAVANLAEAFPAEVRQQGEQGGRERKRRRGRMAILAHEFETPPVYVRPEDVERPEVVMEPKDDDENPARLPRDDHDYRAEAAASLDAVLNKTEGERRHEWLKIDPELRKIVRDLHVNFGHPTNVTLQRILRKQNAKSEAIREAGLLACDSCGESI